MFQRVVRFVTLGLLVGGSLNGCADDAPAGSERDGGVAPDDVDGVQDVGQPDGSDPGPEDSGRDVQGGDDATDGGSDVAVDAAADGADGDSDTVLCEEDTDCLVGTCVALAPGDVPGVCAELCGDDSDCDDGSSCLLLTNSGSDAVRVCIVNDFCLDQDSDQFGIGPGCLGVDCNDDEGTVNLAADELCDGQDNDCDESIDENAVGTGDRCETGFAGDCAEGRQACVGGSPVCTPDVAPQEELCDGVDNDCDGTIDNNVASPTVWYEDADGDSYGGATTAVQCEAPAGYVERGGDCDDTEFIVYPGGPEQCDGLDNDCDGEIDASPRLRPCELIDCGPLPNPVNGRVSFPDGTTYGATAEYTCTAGYERLGIASRTCELDGSWAPDEAPTCEPLDCGAAPTIANATVNAPATTTGELATYSCRTGFNQRSGTARTALCTASGWEFTGATMACDRVTCGDPPPISSGSVALPDGDGFGATATYSCNTGYALAGVSTITCEATGSWSPTLATCVPSECGSPSPVANASVSISGTTTGAIATYFCLTGYTQVAGTQRTRTCLSDGWTWSGTPMACEGVPCAARPEIPNGTLSQPASARFGDSATYTCNPGYVLTGAASSTCRADQSWSNPSPSCEPIDCGSLSNPVNGRVSLAEGTSFGDTAAYSCLEGYSLSGAASRSCGADGQWSPSPAPTCQPLDCGTPPSVANTTVNAPTTTTGATASWSCNTGFNQRSGTTRTAQCTPTGWSFTGTPIACDPVVCGAPPGITSGTVATPGGSEFGATAVYACNAGYTLTGTATVTCQADGQWSPTLASCQPRDCGAPPSVTNTTVSAPTTTTGSVATWNCNTGFNQRGGTARTAQCTPTGWEFAGTPIACDRVLCGTPSPLAFGAVSTPSGNEFGALATYSCNAGYELAGLANITCQADGQWSPTLASCLPLDCGAPSPVSNAAPALSSTTTGSVATYSCNTGYTQVGGTSRTRTCLADGWQWSGTAFACEGVRCSPRGSILNGSVDQPADPRFGAVAAYRCNAGYTINGAANATCEADGSWSEPVPSCLASSCGPVGTVTNASVFVSDGTTGGTATFTCNEGYQTRPGTTRTRTCTSGGWQWDGTSLICDPVSCGAPGLPLNGTVSTPGGQTFGQVATYTCSAGYQLAGPGTRTCGSDGTWSGVVPECRLPCGDGVLQSGQACDDANIADGDGCSSLCEIEPGFECFGAPTVCGRPQTLQWNPNELLSDYETYTTPAQTLASCNTVVRAEVTSVWSPAHTFAGDLVLSVRSPGSAPTFFIYRNSVGGSDDYFGETTVLTTNTIIGRSGNGPWEWRAFDDAVIDTGTIQSVTLRIWCR
ncbi:MAG: hypothetical protein KGO50_10850 [Myxococcales bacterium]|nr:hypothetical protein [Myxococcales bacterium]